MNPNSSQKLVESIVVKNNGRAFTTDDWRRLKKIAEGNPDEQKVIFFEKSLMLIPIYRLDSLVSGFTVFSRFVRNLL